jgi:Tfp pilus assembly protein PilV
LNRAKRGAIFLLVFILMYSNIITRTVTASSTGSTLGDINAAKSANISVTGIATTTQSTDWKKVYSGAGNGFAKVIWANNQFVAVGENGIISTSPDGLTWKLQYAGLGRGVLLTDIIWDGAKYIAVGTNGTMITSVDGANWTKVDTGFSGYIYKIVYSGSKYVAIVQEWGRGTLLTSEDGVNWALGNIGNYKMLTDITWNGNQYVLVGYDGDILTSTDGTNWTRRSSPAHTQFSKVIWAGNRFIAVGHNGVIVRSLDGINWFQSTSNTGDYLTSVAWNGQQFVATGQNWNTILTSPDGVNWSNDTQQNPLSGIILSDVTWGNNRFIIVCGGGKFLTKSTSGLVSEVVSLKSVTTQNTSVTFRYYSTTAQSIKVGGTFNNGQYIDLTDEGNGIWSVNFHIDYGRYGYYFLVDNVYVSDPFNSMLNGNYYYNPATGVQYNLLTIEPDMTAPECFASPSGGFYTSEQAITLNSSEPGNIYYTLDGSDPNLKSSLYTKPIIVSRDTTLKYMAVDEAGNQSYMISIGMV